MQNSYSVNKMTSSPQVILGHGFTESFSNHVMTCQMDGDSMQPTIEPGEVVAFVDCGGQIKLAGIYVFTRELFGREVLFIKRVQVLPSDELMIISDHKAYETYQLDAEAQKGMTVYRRDIASLNVRRFV